MSSNVAALRQEPAGVIEQVLIQGDLKNLSQEERTHYYMRVCDSMGLNPLTQPFAYIVLNGKLTLYAKRDAADQLRKINGVSIKLGDPVVQEGVCIVKAHATDRSGRVDEATGAVPIAGLKGEALANAFLKCETKAKRRVTLSICGLGWLDETEVDSIERERDKPERPTATPQQRLDALAAPRSATAATATAPSGELFDADTGEILEPPANGDWHGLQADLVSRARALNSRAALADFWANDEDVQRLKSGAPELAKGLHAQVNSLSATLPGNGRGR